jgi:flagellar biosynthesis/type III secretory pathway protein FliH
MNGIPRTVVTGPLKHCQIGRKDGRMEGKEEGREEAENGRKGNMHQKLTSFQM